MGLGGSSEVVGGDQNGGKIPNTLDTPDKQTAAYRTVTTYCEKFGKRGYITKMDYDTGLVMTAATLHAAGKTNIPRS